MDRISTDQTTLNLKADGSFNLPFSAVMDQTFIDVIINDDRGKLLFINRSFEKFSGLSRDKAVGRSIETLKEVARGEELVKRLRQVMASGATWEGKLTFQTCQGDVRTYYATISPIREETGKGDVFLSVLRDISELEMREKQLQQAGKMEAIGTLAGGIAHDFNNILAGMVGYAELVKEDLDGVEAVKPKTQTRLDNIISGAMRAKTLIQQILTFSRSGREALSPVSARLMVKEVVQLLRASLPSTIKIELTLASEALILAEPTQIHQILMNLCTNARDAMMDEGGQLSICLMDVRDDGTPGEKTEWVLLRVADTGPGIGRDIRHKVMEPFFTTKPLEKGTGMGLSVVHGIVNGLGGRVEIRENSPRGAVFDIHLPRHNGEGRQEETRASVDLVAAGGKNECLLFVDDETDLIAIAEDGLGSMGYRVIGFDDSRKALGWFRNNIQVPDLLISDVTMPGLPGDLLTREIRKLRPDLPVLLITGASERVSPDVIEELGVEELLYKPMVLGELSTVIRKILDREGHGRHSDH